MIFRDPLAFLNEVEAVARIGAAELMPYWQRLEPGQVEEKATNDLVTAADKASEKAIIAAVAERFPDHRILAEESGAIGDASDTPTWIIDPLDGTTNFVHCVPHFSVSIGVAVGDRVDFAVVLEPLRDDVFRAARGSGATRNGRAMTCSSRTGLRGALLSTGFPFKIHHLIDPYLQIFRSVFMQAKAVRRTGSAALDLAYVAEGIYDGFFEFGLAPWDLAAGSLLVEEAGGVITAMNGSADYMTDGHVVCGTEGVHRDLVTTIADIDPPVPM